MREESPIITAGNRGLRYGDGIFETMKVVNGVIKLSIFHFERLFQGLNLLRISFPRHIDAAYLQEQVVKTVSKNRFNGAVRVRLTVCRGNGGLYETGAAPNFIIECWELPPTKQDLNVNGLEIGNYTEVRKSCDALSNVKSNNYLIYVMAALYAKENKYNDCLVFNTHNRICESTISNVFMIENQVIYTPPLSEGCVAGVMRKHLLELLPEKGYEVIEKPLSSKEIEMADELFLTNAMGLRWVKSMNDKSFNNQMTKAIFHSTILAD